MTDRKSLISGLRAYHTSYPEEQGFARRFLTLLEHPRCYQRDHLPGHITGSAWIVNPDRSKVVLVQHAKLKRWLQPGGHADGDENIYRVALKEADEETGLTGLKWVGDGIFDIDIHEIPARNDLSFPAHDHYDVRFLFEAPESQELKISHESTDLKWISLASLQDFNPEPSVLRMRSKLQY